MCEKCWKQPVAFDIEKNLEKYCIAHLEDIRRSPLKAEMWKDQLKKGWFDNKARIESYFSIFYSKWDLQHPKCILNQSEGLIV